MWVINAGCGLPTTVNIKQKEWQKSPGKCFVWVTCELCNIVFKVLPNRIDLDSYGPRTPDLFCSVTWLFTLTNKN